MEEAGNKTGTQVSDSTPPSPAPMEDNTLSCLCPACSKPSCPTQSCPIPIPCKKCPNLKPELDRQKQELKNLSMDLEVCGEDKNQLQGNITMLLGNITLSQGQNMDCLQVTKELQQNLTVANNKITNKTLDLGMCNTELSSTKKLIMLGVEYKDSLFRCTIRVEDRDRIIAGLQSNMSQIREKHRNSSLLASKNHSYVARQLSKCESEAHLTRATLASTNLSLTQCLEVRESLASKQSSHMGDLRGCKDDLADAKLELNDTKLQLIVKGDKLDKCYSDATHINGSLSNAVNKYLHAYNLANELTSNYSILQSTWDQCEDKLRFMTHESNQTTDEMYEGRIYDLESKLQDTEQALALCDIKAKLAKAAPNSDSKSSEVII